MSKRGEKREQQSQAQTERVETVQEERPKSAESESQRGVQNAPPPKRWSNLDHFWHSSVKNGTPLLFESFKTHLRCMGWLEDQSKWVDGAKHFGIPVEK